MSEIYKTFCVSSNIFVTVKVWSYTPPTPPPYPTHTHEILEKILWKLFRRSRRNGVQVLKMMLVEMEKGDDLTTTPSTPTTWPTDMLTAANNLYVQPAASPDSSSGMTSPPAHAGVVYGDGRLQTCGTASPDVELMGSGQFQQAPFPSCGLPDSYGINGVTVSMPNPGFLDSCGSTVPALGDGSRFGSVPVQGSAISAGFPTNAYEMSAVNAVFGQPYSVNGHFSSAQTMLQQSSQCY